MENKNICKLLKTARHNIILKYYGECVWRDTEADYIEDIIRTQLQDNGYTIQDLQGDAPNIDDSQLKDFQLTINRILDDASHVYEGNILTYTRDYLTHFVDYHLDIDTILEYYYGTEYLNIVLNKKLPELNNNDSSASSSTFIETLCNEAWKIIIYDYRQLLTTDAAIALLNAED